MLPPLLVASLCVLNTPILLLERALIVPASFSSTTTLTRTTSFSSEVVCSDPYYHYHTMYEHEYNIDEYHISTVLVEVPKQAANPVQVQRTTASQSPPSIIIFDRSTTASTEALVI